MKTCLFGLLNICLVICGTTQSQGDSTDWFEARLSIPVTNNFYMSKGDYYGIKKGHLGFSIGVVAPLNSFLVKFQAGFVDTHREPIPSHYHPEPFSDYTEGLGQFISLQVGDQHNRIRAYVGAQFNETSFFKKEFEFTDLDTTEYRIRSKVRNVGYATSVECRIHENASLSINYFPSLLAIKGDRLYLHYSHIAFFELCFIIPAQ